MYYLMTVLNVILATILGFFIFLFLQYFSMKSRDLALLQKRALEIKVGDIYETSFVRTPLDEDKPQTRYIVRAVKEGYVKWIFEEYPRGDEEVERASEFLKYKTKVK